MLFSLIFRGLQKGLSAKEGIQYILFSVWIGQNGRLMLGKLLTLMNISAITEESFQYCCFDTQGVESLQMPGLFIYSPCNLSNNISYQGKKDHFVNLRIVDSV